MKGDSGEFGEWQFMPGTWDGVATEIVGSSVPQTPVNERYVAVKKIQKLLDEGKTEREIALIWNTSLGGSERPFEKRGTNKKGVRYDSVAYALKVMTAYAQE